MGTTIKLKYRGKQGNTINEQKEVARVEDRKLFDYLLSKEHLQGRWKATWFEKINYSKENADELRGELLRVFREGELVKEIKTEDGLKYVIEGKIKSTKQDKSILTVWIRECDLDYFRLVTAYPGDD